MTRIIAIAGGLLIAGFVCLSQARLPMTGAGPAGALTVATTTWNPSDTTADITLSNGNLTMTQNANGGSYRGTRAIASATSGKKYWEYHVDNVSTVNPEVGVTLAAVSLTAYLGNTGGCGWLGNGQVYVNGPLITTIATWAIGDTLSVAVDLGNARIWFRKGAGNWNNDASADPANNVNGIDISVLSGAKYAVAQTFSSPTDAYTANFGATAYAQSVPSGYGNW